MIYFCWTKRNVFRPTSFKNNKNLQIKCCPRICSRQRREGCWISKEILPASPAASFSFSSSFPRQLCIAVGSPGPQHFHFSRMRSEGSRFTWGSGGEAVFAKSCVCNRNRRQPSATVTNHLSVRRKALHSGECVWSGPESVSG